MSTDKIFHAIGGTDPLGDYVVGDLIPPDDSYDDTLKISHCKNGTVRAGRVVGGSEDCLDLNNHCEKLVIEADLWEPRGDYLATIKGGSHAITVRGRVRGHGRVVDIDLGNISDQSDDATTGVALDLLHEAGEPITVRVLNALEPQLLNAVSQRYIVTCKIPGFWRPLWAKAVALWRRVF